MKLKIENATKKKTKKSKMRQKKDKKIENATKKKDKKSKMRQNTNKKPFGFCLCIVLSVWLYVGVCSCVYMWMRVFRLSQARNQKALAIVESVTNVY